MPAHNDTSWGLIFSLILHGLVIFLGLWGLPFLGRRMPPEPPRPIPIDVVTVDQFSQAPRPKPKPPKKPAPPSPVPEKKPEPEPERPEPLIKAEEKPLPTPPKPKEDKNPSEVPLPTPPKEEPQKTEKKEKKPEKKKEPKKEKPKEKPKKEDTKKQQKKRDFQAVLKNLEASLEEDVVDSPEPDLESLLSNAAEKVSDTLTISEMDLIKRQLMECWNVPAGAKDAKELVIVLDLVMSRDGTVQKASLMPEKSSTNHPFYRTGAESALRAVRNPRCTPLKLPPDRYESWKNFEVTFNPKDVR